MNPPHFPRKSLAALAALAALPAMAQLQMPRTVPGMPGVSSIEPFPATQSTSAAPANADSSTLAAPAANQPTIRLSPAVSFAETWTDNLAQNAASQDRSGWITDLTPSLRADLATARLLGFVDYRLHQLYYSGAEGLDRRENYLQSFLRVKAVEEFLFVEARANVQQASISPFGVASTPGQAGAGSNRTETRTASLSPYVRGQAGDFAVYQVRFNASATRTQTELVPSTQVTEWTAQAATPSGGAVFGWVADATSLEVRNALIDKRDNRRVRAGLVYKSPFDVRATVLVLHESTDFVAGARSNDTGAGFGLDWAPSPRTRASALVQRRFFGTGHEILATQRMARTAFSFTSTRDALVPGSSGIGALGSLRNVLQAAMASATLDPSDVGRSATRRFEAAGLADASPINTETLATRPYLYQAQSATFVALGQRNTLTLTANRREQRSLEAGTTATLGGDVRQRGFDAGFSTRLTPLTSASLGYTRLDSRDLGGTRDTGQQQVSLALTTKLGPRTTAAVGARRLRFASNVPGDAFHESAVFFVLGYRP